MNVLRDLPGPFLIFLGAISLSFGGLIVKSFEGASLWQILFWRSLFFTLTVLVFFIITYKTDTLKSFYFHFTRTFPLTWMLSPVRFFHFKSLIIYYCC